MGWRHYSFLYSFAKSNGASLTVQLWYMHGLPPSLQEWHLSFFVHACMHMCNSLSMQMWHFAGMQAQATTPSNLFAYKYIPYETSLTPTQLSLSATKYFLSLSYSLFLPKSFIHSSVLKNGPSNNGRYSQRHKGKHCCICKSLLWSIHFLSLYIFHTSNNVLFILINLTLV